MKLLLKKCSELVFTFNFGKKKIPINGYIGQEKLKVVCNFNLEIILEPT